MTATHTLHLCCFGLLRAVAWHGAGQPAAKHFPQPATLADWLALCHSRMGCRRALHVQGGVPPLWLPQDMVNMMFISYEFTSRMQCMCKQQMAQHIMQLR